MYVLGHVLQEFNSFQPATQRKIIKMKGIDWIFEELLKLMVGNFLFPQVKEVQSHTPITMWMWVWSAWGKGILSQSRAYSAYQCKNLFILAKYIQWNQPPGKLWLWKERVFPERKESPPAFGRMDPPWIQQLHSQQAHTDTASFTAGLQRSWNQNLARRKGMPLSTVCQYSTMPYLLTSSR